MNDSPEPATNPAATERDGMVTAASGADTEYQSVTGMTKATPDREARADSDKSITLQPSGTPSGSPGEAGDTPDLADSANPNDTTQALVDTLADTSEPNQSKSRLDPTRYGDWEKNGRCIDF